MINQTLSHYRIRQKLGRGGMGEVYLAEDANLPRQVAIKFMAREFAEEPELRERFQHEARAAALVNHPNVVTIYEVGEFDRRPYIVMEYIDGESLAALIARRELGVDEVIDLALQICAGLAKAHQKGVLHRDLKPANILLDSDGRIKIVDFGLAKIYGATSLTTTGNVMGTPAYMSPEQMRGWELDPRSDIFSLGVVLYQLITRRMPFESTTREALLLAILQQEPEPLARYKRGVTPGLQSLVDKALDKDLDLRYQNVESLAVDLRREKKLSANVASATIPLPKKDASLKREPPQREEPKPRREAPLPDKPKPTRRLSPSSWIWLGVGALVVIFVVYWLASRDGEATKLTSADFAALSITTTPDKATVLLDGNAIGSTPITSYRANAGKAALRIWKTNYFTVDTAIVLAKGRETKLSFRLQSAFARVTIRIDPADAEVILDGKSYAASQREKLPVDLGMHRLNLSREGYIPKQIEFRVATAKDTTLRFALERNLVAEYGTIRVQAFLNGRVYIGDDFKGNIAAGEAREYDQPVGSYKVEVRDARENVSQTANVVKGKTVTVTLRPKPVQQPVEPKTIRAPVLRSVLRNDLSDGEVKSMLAVKGFFDNGFNKGASGFANDYELRTVVGEQMVVDKATGLIWQRGGPSNTMIYADAEKYIEQLNNARFAGFSDWRLPTLEEAMSLMEPRKLNAGLYIDPKFDKTQSYIWTADKKSAGVAWMAYFYNGLCLNGILTGNGFVRAVRVGQ
jgi:serine/threonine protein kinase